MNRILFVHNAHSGLGNALLDGVHKMVRPKTYPCKLCALTYGAVRVKKDWEMFYKSLDVPVDFMYKDQFDKKFPGHPFKLPAAFADDGMNLELKISSDDFDKLKDLDELIALAREKLN